jgi:DNA-binding PadR family transcriptional regulator
MKITAAQRKALVEVAETGHTYAHLKTLTNIMDRLGLVEYGKDERGRVVYVLTEKGHAALA